MKSRVLCDEHIPRGIVTALRLRGEDCTHVEELGRKGLSDAEHLDYAAANSFAFLPTTYRISPLCTCAISKKASIMRESFLHRSYLSARQCDVCRSFYNSMSILRLPITSGISE